MLIGIMGKMGAGKTLSMTIIASFLKNKVPSVPLSANYQSFKQAVYINSVDKIWQMDSGIFCYDEIWLTMDSRLWKDNVKLTRWVNQTRKKKMLVFFTTQHINQVELRVRKATDILIYCAKNENGDHVLTFIDYQYMTIGRKYVISRDVAQKFYPLYDTYEVLKPMT